LEHTRRRFYEKELFDLSSTVTRDVDILNSEVTSTLYSCDESITQARELDDMFNRMLAERCGMADAMSPGKDDALADTSQSKPNQFFSYQYCLDEGASIEWQGQIDVMVELILHPRLLFLRRRNICSCKPKRFR
jgi:hypothetical protein